MSAREDRSVYAWPAMRVLVTGGAGYIGSHAVLALLSRGDAVTVVDSFIRSDPSIVHGLTVLGDLVVVGADVNDRSRLVGVLHERRIDAVLHFAALASVPESLERPLDYARANVAGTVSVLEAMRDAAVPIMVFSSSCATYGEPDPGRVPIDESCPQHPVHPYGFSKLAGERILLDQVRAQAAAGGRFQAAILRYFNVAGADPQGRVGERHEPETHLIPCCLEVALGVRDALAIYGTDYPTPDGTCIRDYVHVCDLVDAHLAALDRMAAESPKTARADEAGTRGGPSAGAVVFNVGLGRGFSVREVLETCRRVTGRPIRSAVHPRRPGDPPTLVARADRVRSELGWSPRYDGLEEIVRTAWRWMQRGG